MKKIGLEIYEDGFEPCSTPRGNHERCAGCYSTELSLRFRSQLAEHYRSALPVHVSALAVMRAPHRRSGFVNDYPLELILMNAE
ncbi:MAG: hypothetical protein ACLR0U_29240 [Enterocloster clostridioformis]